MERNLGVVMKVMGVSNLYQIILLVFGTDGVILY